MKIIKLLFSGAFMGILLLVFAYAIGYATFVENDYGPIAAKVLVYNAKWFEILMLLMVINFAGMIFTHFNIETWTRWLTRLASLTQRGGLLVFSTLGPELLTADEKQRRLVREGFWFMEEN